MPVVRSPLSIIALFVSLIELFLVYPVTQLQGSDRTMVVLFIVSFPVFVASLFFFVLWHKPLHLYSPEKVPPELRTRIQSVEVALDRAVGQQRPEVGVEVTRGDRARVSSRAERVAPIVQGARVLWVDDHPEGNINERAILESLKIRVDEVLTTEQALSNIAQQKYDVVISDMRRGENPTEGLRFLQEMRRLGRLRPTIFYMRNLDREKGTPPYAFAVTNRPDHLIHYVFDIMEREKG